MKSYNNNEKLIIKLNIKTLIGILFAVILILALFYVKIIGTRFGNYKFSNQTEKFTINNERPIFRVDKIVLYSSASAEDNSSEEVLQDMNISQFTDISVNINNKMKREELTDENIVKKIYIDSLNIESESERGEKILNYKNPYIFGKYKTLENVKDNRIDFKIIKSNQENDSANYDEPTYYADCSNPISLGYINKNLVTRYSVSDNKNSVTFDGRLLKNANVKFKDMNCRISFKIHLVNNKNKEFECLVVIDNDLDNKTKEIYKGSVLKTIETQGEEYNFIQIN